MIIPVRCFTCGKVLLKSNLDTPPALILWLLILYVCPNFQLGFEMFLIRVCNVKMEAWLFFMIGDWKQMGYVS